MTDTAMISGTQAPLNDEALKGVRVAALWDVVHRPVNAGTFPARTLAARKALKLLERDLGLLQLIPGQVSGRSSAVLEIKANLRQLRAAAKVVADSPKSVARLPRIVLPEHRDEPRIAAVAALYVRATDGHFSAQGFSAFIAAVQEREPLTLDELWNSAGFLQFTLLELLLVDARALLSSTDADPIPPVSIYLRSLTAIGHTDWSSLIEPLITFDSTLRKDPAHTYESMDFDSREIYRRRVALIARNSDCVEAQVAQIALDLALEGAHTPTDDPRILRRRIHIGYYLIDKGFPQLAARTGYLPPLLERLRMLLRDQADYFYITGIQLVSIFFIAALILLPLSHFTLLDSLIAALLLFMPAMQCAVELLNSTVTAIFDPDHLPKLDFSKRISPECATLVAVPTLLLSEDQVRCLVTDLEVRFLANRDPQLHFALLTDLPDSVTDPRENDSHPLVELVVRLIHELNAKYSSNTDGAFILLHRRRVFNVRQGVWMGWERKRGKLLDLNKLLTAEFDAFPIKAGRLDALKQIRYVLTLDSDTQLPRGAAGRLIGAIAHPLHQAVIHPKLGIVVEGYGILQPRIGVSVRSASRSRMAAIYSGQSGFDIYARAISDAYQDLYGEGIFTGKGIYEVATLHAVLEHRFPRNSLLSHDLIEGAYARAGLATDVELVDDYPSHLSAFNRRKHRWVRGDWQIVQWIFPRVPDESGRPVPSPISSVARWKIFDNLRRSLVEPFTLILFAAGWLGLPGGPLYWTVVSLMLLIFPTVVQFSFALGHALANRRSGSAVEAFSGFSKAVLATLLNLVFLPHQTLLSLDAIVRALVRRFITGERLLEWETAAQAELKTASRTTADRYLALSPLVVLITVLLVLIANPHHWQAFEVAAPILLLWCSAPIVTAWLNARPREQRQRLATADQNFLMAHALHIWRFFRQFGEERHNYLIPDNVEEENLFEAARVSPTNMGLLLNARQAACEFGFLTVPEFVSLTDRTLSTIARLESFRGHLYNWYDTRTLEPLPGPLFVSSVDSGNFVASLYTLHSGALALRHRPLFSEQLFAGLREHWLLLTSQNASSKPLLALAPPVASASLAAWIAWLSEAQAALTAIGPEAEKFDAWWIAETKARVRAIESLLEDFLPWMLPEYASLLELPELSIKPQIGSTTPSDAAALCEAMDARLAHLWLKLVDDPAMLILAERLRAALQNAKQRLHGLSASLCDIAKRAEEFAAQTDFAFLADPARHILSIGYDVRAQKLHESCYDLLASEARVATFLAIARNELPPQSWIKMSRAHAHAFGHFLLISWTGTMFEYLMPELWMRSYPDTLISRTLTACVQVQRAFARSLNIPWGISESGAAKKDEAGHYQYRAYGVPQTALSIDAVAGPVISPYSTFLALGVDAVEALHNLRRMASAGWVGAYGFYEAADYSASASKPELVREWMAHHQGMSLLAILNLLHDDVVQRWFHANPLVQATELLLHEMPVSTAVLRAGLSD